MESRKEKNNISKILLLWFKRMKYLKEYECKAKQNTFPKVDGINSPVELAKILPEPGRKPHWLTTGKIIFEPFFAIPRNDPKGT